MPIFLAQHGLCLPKQKDPEKGLSESGRENTRRIARVAADYKIKVMGIRHSGKTRAAQTAGIFGKYLGPAQGPMPVEGMNPLDDVKAFAHDMSLESNYLYVGHLPFMERLVSFLTAGCEEPRVLRFQNSGIVCMDKDDAGWFIRWTLNPDIS